MSLLNRLYAKKRLASGVSLLLLLGFIAIWQPTAYAQAYDMLVSSTDTSQVLRYNGDTGAFIDDFASGGGLFGAHGLSYGPDGNLYVCDRYNYRVLRYDGTTGAFIDVFVSAGSGGLSAPLGMVFGPDDNLYVCSYDTNNVLRYNGTTGAFIDVFASGNGLNAPQGLTFGPDGNLYISSEGSSQILRYNGTTGAFIDIFVAAGSGGLDTPFGLVFGPDGDLYVSNRGVGDLDTVLRYNGTTGAFIDSFVSPNSGGLRSCYGLQFGPDGNLYVCSSLDSRVLRYDGITGAFIDAFVGAHSGGLVTPVWLIFQPHYFALTGFKIGPGILTGGTNATGFVFASEPAPAGGAVVSLISSNPNAVNVPTTVTIPAGAGTAHFTVQTNSVAAETPVTITATQNGVSIPATLIVEPLIKALTVTPSLVLGGVQATGKITLQRSVTSGSIVVALSSANPAASVPSTVVIPAGKKSVTFAITTTPVTQLTGGLVSASLGSVTVSQTLTVRPIHLKTLSLSPNRVKGGSDVTGQVTLEEPAAPGDVTVSLSSSDPSVANPAQSTITIPAGQSSATFTVHTTQPHGTRHVHILASADGSQKSKTLTVLP